MNFRKPLTWLILPLLLWACSSNGPDPDNAEGLFQRAQELEKDEYYEEAIQKYSDVKNQYPYSRFAVTSELAIADIHYKREDFIEAQAAYETFKDLHPKHENIAHVTVRLALSLFQQLPATIDRDLSVATKAIQYFDELMQSYPTSEFVTEAKEKKEKTRNMLAEKEMYVAQFYVREKQHLSALGRFENILRLYADLGTDRSFESKALYGAASSAFQIGEHEKGRTYLSKLRLQHPKSDEAERAQKELKKYE